MARETDMSQRDIDEKLAALEEPPEEVEEVEVEPEEDEVEEVEEESAASEDDTDDEEPLTSEGDDDYEEEEEEELDLSKSEKGLLEASIAERKKRQESERKLEKIQEQLEKLQESVTQSQAPTTLEAAYERDPKGVINNINANIATADAEGNTLEVERLRDLKDELKETVRLKQETQKQQLAKRTEIETLLLSSIPDFGPEKAKELTDFALQDLGYESIEELNKKTSFDTVDGVKEIVRINKLYQKLKTQAEAPGKVKKKKVKRPTSVEKSGTQSKKVAKSARDLIEKARKEGSADAWAEVIEKRFG